MLGCVAYCYVYRGSSGKRRSRSSRWPNLTTNYSILFLGTMRPNLVVPYQTSIMSHGA